MYCKIMYPLLVLYAHLFRAGGNDVCLSALPRINITPPLHDTDNDDDDDEHNYL